MVVVAPSDVAHSARAPWTSDHLREYCSDLFASLSRTDQRHAGETYLRGLLTADGRKSIRSLAATTPGRSEQSLQQFVNQSPWDPAPVRERLAQHVRQIMRPHAWTIDEIAFLKNGRYSAAVERQYVRSLEKTSNCQLAVAITLVDEHHSIPVNWKLTVPESWGRDQERRQRARMPEEELPRPYWQYSIEALDDMSLRWGLPNAPILLDTRHRFGSDTMLAALDVRGLPYLAQVGGNFLVGYAGGNARSPMGARGDGWRGAASMLVRKLNPLRRTVAWTDDNDHRHYRSQFAMVPLGRANTEPRGAAMPLRSDRALLTEWPLSTSKPHQFWVTNIVDQPIDELVRLAKLRHRVGPRLEQFAERFGLRDYEGRTFIGWHHHVTLTTAAYVFDLLSAFL